MPVRGAGAWTTCVQVPSSETVLAEGVLSPRARRTPPEGALRPRARRTPPGGGGGAPPTGEADPTRGGA
jgi:hypothetical protein